MGERECQQCGGTGWLWLMRSMFTADGHRRERCGLCGGSGRFCGVGDSAFATEQRELREHYKYPASAGKGGKE